MYLYLSVSLCNLIRIEKKKQNQNKHILKQKEVFVCEEDLSFIRATFAKKFLNNWAKRFIDFRLIRSKFESTSRPSILHMPL